jgi:hypothetical protein
MNPFDAILILTFGVPAALVIATSALVIAYLFIIHVPMMCILGLLDLRAANSPDGRAWQARYDASVDAIRQAEIRRTIHHYNVDGTCTDHVDDPMEARLSACQATERWSQP